MSDPVHIVLAGIGGYGTHYLKTLLQLERAGRVRLAGLVDPAAQASPLYSQAAHIPLFQTLEDCLQAVKADLAVLSSPIQYHASQIITALDHGAHVLCEKPLCATTGQADELIRLQQQSGLQVGIGYQWSFSKAILQARSDVQAGRYGQPQLFRTRVYWPRSLAYYGRNAWVGRIRTAQDLPVYDSVLNNATAHYLHNMLFFLGEGRHDAAVPETAEARLLRANDIETFDTAMVRLEKHLPGGSAAVLLLAVSHTTKQTLNPVVEYQFSDGLIRIADGRLSGRAGPADGGQRIDYGLIDSDDPVADKLEAMLDVVHTGQRPVCDIRTAAAQTRVIAMLHERETIMVVPENRIRRVRHDDAEWVTVPGLEQAMDRFIDTGLLPDPDFLV